MAFSEKDINSLLEAMEKAMRGGIRPSAGRNYNPSRGGGDEGDFGEAIKTATKNTKKLSDALKDVLVEVQDQEDALSKANDSLINSSKSFGSLEAELNTLYRKSLPEARAHILRYSDATKNLTDELSKTIRNQSLFSASLLESHNEIEHGTLEYSEMMKNMYKATDGLNSEILKQAGVWDDTTESIQKNLNPQDFGRLNMAIGNAQLAITESFGGMEGLGKLSALAGMSLEKFVESTTANQEGGKELQSKIFAAIAQLEKQGHKLEVTGVNGEKQSASVLTGGVLDQRKIDALQGNADMLQQVTKLIVDNAMKNEAALNEFAKVAKDSNTVLGGWKANVGKAVEDITGLGGAAKVAKLGLFALADGEVIRKSLAMMREGLTETYKNLTDFNIAQVPMSFVAVNKSAIKMGMSFEETVKFMQENKRAVAIYGDNFDGLTGDLKDTFKKFGYTMKQGAEVVGPTFESAIAAGINVKSTDSLKKFVDSSMQAFQDVAPITNMTAVEFMKLRAALLSSEDIQSEMLGLNQQERIAKVQEIDNTRKSYQAMGLNADAAMDLIRAQAAQKHEAVKDQLAQAGKLALSAQMSGMTGQQASRLQLLSMKTEQGRSADENKEYMALLQQEEQGRAQRMTGAFKTGDVGTIAVQETINQATEGSGAIGAERNAAQKMATTAAAGGALTDAQLKQLADAAKGSQLIADAGNVINTISAALSNSFTTSIFGATGALLGLALQAGITTRALGGVGGAGGIFSKIKGMFGGGGGAAAKATESVVAKEGVEVLGKEGAKIGAKSIGKSLLKAIPGLGVLAGLVFGAQRAVAGDWKGAGLEVASGAVGAIPGVGTAASLALDAGIAARDLSNASPAAGSPPSVSGPGSGSPEGDVNTAATQAAEGTEGGEKILGVQDMTAHDYLSTIADNMAAAVKLLQAMADNGNQVPAQVVANRLQQTTLKPIPTATSYMTGRQTAPA